MYFLVAITIGLMVWGWVTDRRNEPAGRAIMAAGALGLTVLSVLLMVRGAGGEGLQLDAKEEAWARVRGEVLGRHLGQAYAGQRTMVILPFRVTPRPELRAAIIQGVETGFAATGQGFETLDPPMPDAFDAIDVATADNVAFDTTPSEDQWFTAKYLDGLLNGPARGYELVVCLTGMPTNAEEMTHWKQPAGPVLAIDSIRLDLENTLLKAGRLVAAIGAKPDGRFDGSFPPQDTQEAFDTRYEILTGPGP